MYNRALRKRFRLLNTVAHIISYIGSVEHTNTNIYLYIAMLVMYTQNNILSIFEAFFVNQLKKITASMESL